MADVKLLRALLALSPEERAELVKLLTHEARRAVKPEPVRRARKRKLAAKYARERTAREGEILDILTCALPGENVPSTAISSERIPENGLPSSAEIASAVGLTQRVVGKILTRLRKDRRVDYVRSGDGGGGWRLASRAAAQDRVLVAGTTAELLLKVALSPVQWRTIKELAADTGRSPSTVYEALLGLWTEGGVERQGRGVWTGMWRLKT